MEASTRPLQPRRCFLFISVVAMISMESFHRVGACLGQGQRHPSSTSWLSKGSFVVSRRRRPRHDGRNQWQHLSSIARPSDVDANNDTNDNRHLKRYRIQGSTMEQSRSGVRLLSNTGHILQTDLPHRMGGSNVAPQPVETLLAALIGCTQATAVFVGRQIPPRGQWKIDRLEFDLQAVRDERGSLQLPIDHIPDIPSRLQAISGVVRVYVTEGKAIPDSVLRFLQEQTELRCPVANMMISSGCEMNVRWVDGSSTQDTGSEQ